MAKGKTIDKSALRHVLVIHGPNLNLLGTREPGVYGTDTLEDVNRSLEQLGRELGLTVYCIQSNHEGEIVDAIQESRGRAGAILINPGAYTHTSIAIRDAFLGVAIPFVEVHLSNVFAREQFRRQSYLSDVAKGIVSGFGADSYILGLRAIAGILSSKK